MKGKTEKGDGTYTDVAYYMNMITMYMDAPVLMTNMFNNCDLNYFFMKAGKVLCSLSGFLDLLTNFFFRFFDD